MKKEELIIIRKVLEKEKTLHQEKAKEYLDQGDYLSENLEVGQMWGLSFAIGALTAQIGDYAKYNKNHL